MPTMPGCSTFRRIDDRVLRITKAGTPVPEASPAEWEGGVNRCAVQRPEMEMFAQCAAVSLFITANLSSRKLRRVCNIEQITIWSFRKIWHSEKRIVSDDMDRKKRKKVNTM